MHNTHTYGESVNDFQPGQRVALRPSCDDWWRGDRYGNVSHVGRTRVYVLLDSGRKRPIHPSNLAFMSDDQDR